MKTKTDALEALVKLKELLEYGTDEQPKWLKGFCVGMRREGNFDIDICIPTFNAIPPAVKDWIIKDIDGVNIGFRVTTPNTYKIGKDKDKK